MAQEPFGLVLCGGQSTRMGEDKWSLQIGDLCWAEHLAILLEGFSEKVIISSNKKFDLDGDWDFLIDDEPNQGPLGAWVTFARKFPGRDLITVPVDMPLLNWSILSELAGEDSGYLQGPGEKAPLTAYLKAKALEELLIHYELGIRSTFEFWQKIAHRPRIVGSDKELKNLNSPQDLANIDENQLGSSF